MNLFLFRFGTLLFVGIALGALYGMFYAETPFNAAFLWAFRYLTAPILIVVYGYGWWQRRALAKLAWKRQAGLKFLGPKELSPEDCRRRVFWSVVLFGPVLVLFSGGYVNLVNALGSEGPLLAYAGTVQEKFESGGKHRSWHVKILDEASAAPVTFDVPRGEYDLIQVGDRYRRTMRRGLLGIPFERKRG